MFTLASRVESFEEKPSGPVGDVFFEEAGFNLYDVGFAIIFVDKVDGASLIECDFEVKSVGDVAEDVRWSVGTLSSFLIGFSVVAASDKLCEALLGAHDGASGRGDDVVDNGRPGVDLCWVVKDREDNLFAPHLPGLPPGGL